jgi:acyl dehydratase
MIGIAPVHFDDLREGHEIEGISLTVTEAHLVQYAGLSGDFYGLHMDAVAASRTPFGGRVAHGPLTLALVLGQLAQRLIHLGWRVRAMAGMTDLRFPAPVMIGDTLTPLGRVGELDEARAGVTVEMCGRNQNAVDVFTGRFTLLLDRRTTRS